MSFKVEGQILSPAQRRTLPAREAFAQKFPTPEAKSEHFRALAEKANAGRVVLSGDEAAALRDAYRLLPLSAPTTGTGSGPMSVANTLPDEARRAAWDRLWRRLLAPIPDAEPEADKDPVQDPEESAA